MFDWLNGDCCASACAALGQESSAPLTGTLCALKLNEPIPALLLSMPSLETLGLLPLLEAARHYVSCKILQYLKVTVLTIRVS